MNSTMDNVNKENNKVIRGESVDSYIEAHESIHRPHIEKIQTNKKYIDANLESNYNNILDKNTLDFFIHNSNIANNNGEYEQSFSFILIIFTLFVFIGIVYNSKQPIIGEKIISVPTDII